MQSSVPVFDQPRKGGNLSDLTGMNLPNTMRGVTAGGGLIVKFFYENIRRGGVDSDGGYEVRLCVAKQPKGDRLTVACRYITEEQAARDFPTEFSHFKEYGDMPTSGTPLSELPGISMSQIGLLTINGLRSIEDLAEVSPDQVGQFGLDAIRAQKTAIAWLERRDSQSDVIEVGAIEAKYGAENKALQNQLEGAKTQMAQMQAQITALQNMQGQGAPSQQNPAAAGQAAAVAVATDVADEGLEYDVSKMPDPFNTGQDDADPNDLDQAEPDILSDEA